MTTKEELKAKICQAIDRSRDELIGIANAILENPETGFREIKTARRVVDRFAALGIPYRDGLAITGVKGLLKGKGDGPIIAILGELDSLIVPDHPKAFPLTGAAHACGHHAQIALLIGMAMAFTQSDVLPHLSGGLALMAVPAEEYIEIEYREELRQAGKLSFLGGKPELIKLGEFDDVDMAIMTHINTADKKIAVGGTLNGTVAKMIRFIGRSAHAGAFPHQGINALNAATIAISAIHAQRETFREEDTIRVHPIITKGGEVVNAVPADVRLETFVRGKSIAAIKDANDKVDRALRAGALAVGGKVKITTLPGYSPLINDSYLQEIYQQNAISLVGVEEVGQRGHHTGSSDMGDVSHIMPAIHPWAGGASGTSHGNDFIIQDYETAVIIPTKITAMTIIDLLGNDAVTTREILAKSKPKMSKQEYLAYMDSILKEEEYQG